MVDGEGSILAGMTAGGYAKARRTEEVDVCEAKRGGDKVSRWGKKQYFGRGRMNSRPEATRTSTRMVPSEDGGS